MNDHLAWENAMLTGFDAILAYYEPFIRMIAMQGQEDRATLGADDIAQELRKSLWRCWEKQQMVTSIRNFDILVKTYATNTLSTMKGKEFCVKRGRCKIIVFSQLEQGAEGESVDVESLVHRTRLEREEGSDIGDLLEEVKFRLNDDGLQRVFDHIILTDYALLNPDNLTARNRREISGELEISETALLDQLNNICFVLRGFHSTLAR